jgi:hypothetical protein
MLDTLLNEAVSGNKTSVALNLELSTIVSIQGNIGAGFTTATFKLQTSNDGVNWVDLASSTKVVTGAEIIFWDISAASYEYIRVDISSVTGSAAVEIISKKKL